MIDFHSHILPQTDDGSISIEETINILKEANFPDNLVLNYREDALKILHIK